MRLWILVSALIGLCACPADPGPSDAGPLEVVSSTPTPGAVRVPRSVPLTITFSAPVDPATTLPPAISLSYDGGLLPGAVELFGATAAFRPASPLFYGESYVLAASTAVKSAGGAALEADYAAPFTVTAAAGPPSYEYQRPDLWLATGSIRATRPNPYNFLLAHCLGDFDGDGDTDLLTASGDATANPTPVDYFENQGGTLVYDAGPLPVPVPGLVHPRKCIEGDYDGDGRLDVFVAGHGYDNPPFPGEPPLLLVNGAGGFSAKGTPDAGAGFNHGAASGDADEDGDLDIFVARSSGTFWLLNDGAANFSYDVSRLPADLRRAVPVFTSELIDVDGDGHLDLIVSGHEYEGMPVEIFWGDGTGDFSDVNVAVLPEVPGWGVAIDLDADDLTGDGKKDLVINRTGDPTGTGFYVGYRLQLLVQGAARTFTDETAARLPNARSDTAEWLVWLRLQDRDGDGDLDIHVEDAARGLAWLNAGNGTFTP